MHQHLNNGESLALKQLIALYLMNVLALLQQLHLFEQPFVQRYDVLLAQQI
jgi:hypothetical protein